MYVEQIVWREVKTRPPTEDERAEWERLCDEQLSYVFDCPMPADGDEILVATKCGVDVDICAEDYGFYLEIRGDWDDVIAWAEMPKYKGGED